MAGSNVPMPAGEAELRRQLDSILDEAQRLRGDVHSAELARKRATKINLVVLVVLAGFVAMLLAIGYQNNQLAHNTSKTNEAIEDCSTPGGACYEDGRQRTAKAIDDIVKVSIYMAECARLYPGESGSEYDRKLEACVFARLATDSPSVRPTPTPSGSR